MSAPENMKTVQCPTCRAEKTVDVSEARRHNSKLNSTFQNPKAEAKQARIEDVCREAGINAGPSRIQELHVCAGCGEAFPLLNRL